MESRYMTGNRYQSEERLRERNGERNGGKKRKSDEKEI